ncbi:hypothetical protein CNN82_28625 [Pseudomonas frederiksbergensis]|uniref:DUF2806 domain-containing protein n=1 Tax=Pseudomonas frederiksbergensis TaxID=104087 RepID=A0AB33EJY7_9PSED|nr:hypothetical protein CNN82_28625 [Pseudomonas frederiksbergensis]
MDIKDIAGLSKPLTRLIEVISQGVGAVSASYLTKKNAEAKAHEIRVISDALKDVAEQHHLPVVYRDGAIELWQKPEDKTLSLEPASHEDKAALRLDYQERKRQNNIENISSIAAIELAEEHEVSDVKPDEDWVSRFFNFAQDVSSEQMQDLWGRILAGEIKKPGTYSLRTLEFIRNITKSDASRLEHLGKLATQFGGTTFVAMHDKNWMKQNREIYPGHHFEIGEIGAMYPTDLNLRVFRDEETQEEVFTSGALMLLVKRGDVKREINLPMWKFTAVGRELIELIPNANDEGYLESLGRFFLERKAVATLAKIIERLPGGQIRYESIREISSHPSPEATSDA